MQLEIASYGFFEGRHSARNHIETYIATLWVATPRLRFIALAHRSGQTPPQMVSGSSRQRAIRLEG